MKIKVLDCTLRDGGYVNNWEFKKNNLFKISKANIDANIDFLELGFLQNVDFNEDRTLYPSIEYVYSLYKDFDFKNTAPVLMITFSKSEDLVIPKNEHNDLYIRIIFKKNEKDEALKYCSKIKSLGYKIFINPTHTYDYSDLEFLELINEVNEIRPFGFSIVDTNGIFSTETLLNYVSLADRNLNEDTVIGVHCHNNLQLAFANAVSLKNYDSKRTCVVDVSMLGMGRGAGNLNSELFLSYYNSFSAYKYDTFSVLNCINDVIEPIKQKNDWGYNLSFYLSSIHKCHPNYAKFLLSKQNLSSEEISKIFDLIPLKMKSNYDLACIESLYKNFVQNHIDDAKALEKLSSELSNYNVVILGPGSSLKTEQDKISKFIADNESSKVFGINFIPSNFKVDYAFFSNSKRYESYLQSGNGNGNCRFVTTSNLKSDNELNIDFSSCLSDSEYGDSSLLLLLNLLKRIKVKNVFLAGCDGYSKDSSNFKYVEGFLGHSYERDIMDKLAYNKGVSKILSFYAKDMNIQFLTSTNYKIAK